MFLYEPGAVNVTLILKSVSLWGGACNDRLSSSEKVLKVTVSFVDWIVLVRLVPFAAVQDRTVPTGILDRVTIGFPGLTPVGLANEIPIWMFLPKRR